MEGTADVPIVVIIVMAVVVFIVIASIFLMLRFFSRKKLVLAVPVESVSVVEDVDPTLAPLRDYVKTCLSKGFAPEKIISVCVARGWNQEDVKRFL